MGAPADVVRSMREQELEDATFYIHEDNADTVAVFMAMQTQWRVIAGMSAIYQGLDYLVFPVVVFALGIKRADRTRVFHELRAMEIAALAVLNKKPDNNG